MNEHDLNQALRSLSSERMPRAREIEDRLLAAFDAQQQKASSNPWMPILSLAAAASLAAAGFLHDFRPRTPPPRTEQVFLAIPYTVRPAPYEQTSVIRMNVAVAALRTAGFHVDALDIGGSVVADVLLAQDGRAVAIRPLDIPISEIMPEAESQRRNP